MHGELVILQELFGRVDVKDARTRVGDGNVEIVCPDTPANTSRIVPVKDGEVLQVAVTRVKATGTTVDAVWGIV